jgi:ABC-2 type transport system ATP-binding protein
MLESSIPPLVEVHGLSKRFGARRAIEHFSLLLRPGEICGLVGPNGSGKSTTLRMLAGLLRPDSGSGTIVGCEIAHLNRDGRRSIGYLPQRAALYDTLSVFENLRFRAAVFGMADPSAAALDAAALTGLAERAARRLKDLSGGWKRRVEIAATMIHGPSLLLLDEPTTGLDDRARHEIGELISRLATAGAGIVLTSHDAADVQRCTRTISIAADLA